MIAFHFDFNFAHFRIDYLKEQLRYLRSNSYDTIIWELENAVRFDTAPAVAAHDAVSKEEFAELLEYSRSLGFRNVPLLQTLAHTEYVLIHKEYAHLSEGDSGTMYCSSNPELYSFLEKWLNEYCELFYDAPFFHIGCDEARMIGESCPECRDFVRDHGTSALLIKHICRVHGILQKKNIRSAIWADMLVAHREKICELPRDLILFEWRYRISDTRDELFCPGFGYCTEAEFPDAARKEFIKFLYPSGNNTQVDHVYLVDYLRSFGFEVVTCPSTSCGGGSIFTGETEVRFDNTFDSVRKGVAADGCAVTSWTVHLFPYELQSLAIETPKYLTTHNVPGGQRKDYCDSYTQEHFGMSDSSPFLHILSLLNQAPLFTSCRSGSGYYKAYPFVDPEFFFQYVSKLTEEENRKEQQKTARALEDFFLAGQKLTTLRQSVPYGKEELDLWLLAVENLIARSRFALLLLHAGIKERMNPRPLIADLTRLRDATGKMYAKRVTAECLEIFLQILFDAPLAACRKILEESSKGIR